MQRCELFLSVQRHMPACAAVAIAVDGRYNSVAHVARDEFGRTPRRGPAVQKFEGARGDQATRTTFPAFIHFVQTRTRRGSLFTRILAACRLGSHRRFVRGPLSSQEPP